MDEAPSLLEGRYLDIMRRILAAQARSPRAAASVQLLAVSKHQPVESMKALAAALARHGMQPVFGESYVQELKAKRSAFPATRMHLIGPLQSNKVRDAVRYADCIESVHSEHVAMLLDREARAQERMLDIWIEVNVSSDPRKAGFAPEAARAFVTGRLPALPSLKLCGFMTILMHYDNPGAGRADYARLRDFRDSIEPHLGLSMGMSDDFEIAVEEGATEVRIGSLLFGERQ